MGRNLFVRKITSFWHYYFTLLNQNPPNFETKIRMKTDGFYHREDKKEGQRKAKKMRNLQEPKKGES
jgi:hypothetical protein